MTKQTLVLLRIQHRMNFVHAIEKELTLFGKYKFWKHLNKRMKKQTLQNILQNKAA